MLIGHDAVLPQDGRQDALNTVVRAVLEKFVELDLLQVEDCRRDQRVIILGDIWIAIEFIEKMMFFRLVELSRDRILQRPGRTLN